uniref:Tudor domain-containing protein 5 n=1 Tax=Leptobrachium leishanense TaxID=445787 RepID=A0A8C5R289_9ANUR
MDIGQIVDRVQKDVRALLIASKSGLSIQELEKDYRMMIGSNLPLRTLGYRSTMEMLLDMPHVVNVHTKGDGTVVLSAVVDEATKGIAALVSQQKEPSKTKSKTRRLSWRPRCHVDIVRRGRAPPLLPATVKSDLRDLLSISSLLVSEFERAFLCRFGRTFQYTRYGFYSMLEVIGSISDIVEVKQTRAGSLLSLRTPVTCGRASGERPRGNILLLCIYCVPEFENELRLCLARKGAGGSIGPDFRLELQKVMKQHPEGLLVSQLPVLFKSCTGKELPYKELGFMSVMELVGSLGDMLHLESTNDGKDWQIYDIETKDDQKLLSDAQTFSNWNMPQPQEMQVKPVGLKVCQADPNLWWGPLELQLPSSDEHEIPPDAVRRQKLHCLPRMKRGFMIGVFIENITSPSEFYVRCYGKDTSEKLEDMMIEMRRCYSAESVSSRYMVPEDCVSVGEIYSLRAEGDVWWYRVIVHDVVNAEDVTVFYPDFGNVSTVKRSLLRFLKQCYMKLPAQALPSCLAFVTPVEEVWSTRAIKRFQQNCSSGPLVGLVLQYVVDILYLFLCDTSSVEDVYLHQLLTAHGLAHDGQEPGFYKVSNFLMYRDKIHVETKLDMPYLEAVTTGADVWDENWLFTSGTATLNDTVEDVNAKICPDPISITDVSSSIRDSLEEFYISIIKSRKSQDNTDVEQPQVSLTSVEEKPCDNNHISLWEEPTYYQQNSLNPFTGLQKLQIPRSTMVALGPAARMATAGSFLSWVYSSLLPRRLCF